MRPIIDLQVDSADDIILVSNDALISEDILQNNLDTGARRIVGRYGDSLFSPDLCAGLERFLFSKNIVQSSYEIKDAIARCLSQDNLFSSNEFTIKVVESENIREAKLYIIFRSEYYSNAKPFRIFVDIENQRVYKG